MSVLVDEVTDLAVNDMGPLLHIYLGDPVVGSPALCGHRCPREGTERPHDPMGRHCVACVEARNRMIGEALR